MSENTIKLFVGTDAAGKRLKAAIKKIAEEKYFGKNNMSKLIVRDFCEKYGFDPETGKKCPTSAHEGSTPPPPDEPKK